MVLTLSNIIDTGQIVVMLSGLAESNGRLSPVL